MARHGSELLAQPAAEEQTPSGSADERAVDLASSSPRPQPPSPPPSPSPPARDSRKTRKKRARSASEQAASPPRPRAPSVNANADATDVDTDSLRRFKSPRLSAWPLALGISLSPDEQRLALPLLFNARLPFEPEADAAAFAALERAVAAQLPRVAAVLSAEGLSPGVTCARRATVERDGADGPFLKFVSAKLLPFSLEVVTETVRQVSRQAALPTPTTTQVQAAPGVVFAKQQYLLRPDRDGGGDGDSAGVPLLLRCAFRHADEGDRVVGVWSGTGEWLDDVASAGAPIREQGWILIQRYPLTAESTKASASPETSAKASASAKTPAKASALARCLVHSCLYVTPGLSDAAIRTDESYLDVLSTVTVPSYQKLIDEREQMFENRFMDRMLQVRAAHAQRVRPRGYTRSSSL